MCDFNSGDGTDSPFKSHIINSIFNQKTPNFIYKINYKCILSDCKEPKVLDIMQNLFPYRF